MDFEEHSYVSGDNNPKRNRTRSALPQPRSYDTSELDQGSRNGTMPQHNSNHGHTLKHKVSGLPEPASKRAMPASRQTLVDRAGAVNPMHPPAPPSSRPVNGSVRATTIAGVRNTSHSSASSRSTSQSSRNTSGTSFTSMRPPSSSSSYRPQSALSHGRNPLAQSAGNARPATSFEDHMDDKTRKGMTQHIPYIYPTPEPSTLYPKRQRRRNDQTTSRRDTGLRSTASEASMRNVDGSNPFRDVSITLRFEQMSLNSKKSSLEGQSTTTPSYLPKPVTQPQPEPPSTQITTPRRSYKSPSTSKKSSTPMFLSKTSNTPIAWDTQGRVDDMGKTLETFREQMASITNGQSSLQEQNNFYKTRINELEAARTQLLTTNAGLQADLDGARVKLASTQISLEDVTRVHALEIDDRERKHRNALEDLRDEQRRNDERSRLQASEDLDRLRRQHADDSTSLEGRLRTQVEEERTLRLKEVQELNGQIGRLRQDAELDAGSRDRELSSIQTEVNQLNNFIEEERALNVSLKRKLTDAAANVTELESALEAAKAKTHFLESDSQAQSQAFADLNARMQEAIESATEANTKLRQEETLRRKLHNQVQELKGNIRVFCRVRPTLDSDSDDSAKLLFPDSEEDSKELVVTGPESKSAMGTVTTSKHPFTFDRVFAPTSQNTEIFEEISQLVQSALDGYNVCIFCYGQTGSGKTHTMSSADGMIPLAVHQIYDAARNLKEKGWSYSMEGSFVEVYNENLNDLLGKADDLDKKKHEIRHDTQKGKTTITDVTTVQLETASTVNDLLKRATANRTVAATKANERSSRSHSVFILKLAGENTITGEKSEGTLNLVDLAGSERLAHSAATGDRLKETQNINRSLSCLGDVISALGQGKDGGHIPYRNSKLTYLLQHSLGGNSKTLMFVMVSPLQPHLSETLTSLKFATKVHNTHIGTAKKQTKVRDS